MGNKAINVFFIHDDAVPLFFGEQGSRFGGAEIQIFMLARELSKNPQFEVAFLTGEDVTMHYEGIKFLKIDESVEDLIDPGSVIIQRIPSRDTQLAAKLALQAKSYFIYQVSSDTDIEEIQAPSNDLSLSDVRDYIYESDIVVTQHEGQLHEFLKHSAHEAMVIPNGFKFPGLPEESTQEYVLWVGRCAPIKNPWAFLELARLFPEENFKMLLMRDSHYLELYDAVSATARMIDNVDVSQAPFTESQKVFNRAKMLVSTSIVEGFPNVFLQAAIAGIPIVSLNVDPEPIFGDLDSYLFSNGSTKLFAEQIKRLLENNELACSMGKTLFVLAKEKYDICKVANLYSELILSLPNYYDSQLARRNRLAVTSFAKSEIFNLRAEIDSKKMTGKELLFAMNQVAHFESFFLEGESFSIVSDMQLANKKILLLFMTSVEYSARVQTEVHVLKSAGATVDLMSTLPNKSVSSLFNDIIQVREYEPKIVAAKRFRNFRSTIAEALNFVKASPKGNTCVSLHVSMESELSEKIKELHGTYDVIWVYDSFGLPAVMQALKDEEGKPLVVYEIQDLVTEYSVDSAMANLRKCWESESIKIANSFIAAGDSYKDYYFESHPQLKNDVKSLVWPNFPNRIMPPTKSCRSRSFLFYGNLAPDRPVQHLIKAIADVRGNFTVSFVGQNRIDDEFMRAVHEHELEDKVFYLGILNPLSSVEFASFFDIGIVALDGINENERRAPTSKLGTYLAAGLGIVASDLPGIRMQAGSDLDAIYVRGGTQRAWTEALQRAVSMSDDELFDMKASSYGRALEIGSSMKEGEYINVFL